MKAREKASLPHSYEQVIAQYFKCIDNKDLVNILNLFDYDAVVHEPFSNVRGGLKGLSAIEPFLKVAMMANSSLHRTIRIENPVKANSVVAMITFEKGDKIKAKFTFGFQDQPDGSKKIKSLRIEFV